MAAYTRSTSNGRQVSSTSTGIRAILISTAGGADRGLRGITFDGDDVYVAASDELFCYDRNFEITKSYRNRYLKHCHEIIRKDRYIFLTSTGFDSLLGFNLDTQQFDWGFRLLRQYEQWTGYTFDPRKNMGPRAENDFHINMVHADGTGIYFCGLHTKAVLHLNRDWAVAEYCSLPVGAHNGRPSASTISAPRKKSHRSIY